MSEPGRVAFETFQKLFGQHDGEALTWDGLVTNAPRNNAKAGRVVQQKWAAIEKAVVDASRASSPRPTEGR